MISILLFLAFFISFTPTHLYAQDESLVKNPTDSDTATPSSNNVEKTDKAESTEGFKKKFIRINKKVSKQIDEAAEGLDKSVSPEITGAVEKNKSKIFFVIGGDFSDNGDIKSNFRFGAHLHLPRFEKYWSVKFANQDEKRDRGQSSVTRRQRTRNTNDDVFVGVNFAGKWDRVKVSYKPQIAIKRGVGLDHSIEAETEYEFGKYRFEPSLEFFANHDDGTGFSSSLKFLYALTKSFSLQQGNDARFVNLTSQLAVNHYIGFGYIPTDRLSFTTHYFRSFRNETRDYELAAYGTYIATNYMIYRNMLSIEVKPYIVFEREDNFKQTNGIVANLRVSF